MALPQVALAHPLAPHRDVLVRSRRYDKRVENHRRIRLVQARFDVFNRPVELDLRV